MCLVLFAIAPLDHYRFVVAANRDEYYERPTRPATFWPENPEILAGKDLSMGGTWMGVTKSGRFAAVTNFRETPASPVPPLSRGEITTHFLESSDPAEAYLDNLATRASMYRGFNLILGDGDNFFYYSNQLEESIKLEPGFYGLSNQLIDCDWPKVSEGREKLRSKIESKGLDQILFNLLSDEGDPRAFSNSFIASAEYGTRSQSVMTHRTDGTIKFSEKNFSKNGRPESSESFTFSIL
ncbi:MAG TPA: hypothetical protein DCM54_14900 [Gammaproteobacteria bacterium]|nr:hypothetical protein [Gammaproteobacteria bacterium]